MIVDRFCRMRHASPRLKTVVGVAAALAAFAIACSKDSTGPGAAPVVHTSGALLVTTTYANPLAAGAPVVRARLIARYADATVAKDTIVTLPPGADPQLVSLTVLLTTGTASGRQDMTASVRLIGAAGDTLFAGGPVGGSAVAAAVGSPATITIPLVYAGPGRTAKTLTLVPHDTALAFGDSIVVAAQVRDTAGALLPGTLVAWSSQDVSRVTVRSKFGGMLGGGTTRGLTRVIATTLTGQADTVNITTQPVATALALVSGSGQAGTVGTPLALPLRVRVTAADLLGVRFIPVTFTVTSGGGSVSSTTVVTDSGGVAQTTQTLGTAAGAVTVTAAVGGTVGSPVTFTQSATAGPATKVGFSVAPPVSVGAGTAFAPALQAQVQDALGNLVSGATATIDIAIGANPAGGTLSGTASVATVGGIATFAGLSINKTGAGYTLVVSSAGLASATSNGFAVVLGAPVALQFLTNPFNAASLASIAPAVRVAIVDAGGNTVTSAARSVTISIVGGTGTTGALLSGTIGVGSVAGIATFSSLGIDKAGSGYQLTATSTGLSSATSTPFDIDAGPAARLAFRTAPPTSATSLTGFAIVVEVRDAANNLVTSATNSVTLAKATGPAAGTLGGTLSGAAVAGVATFAGITLDKSGSYTVSATSAGLTSVTSGGLAITPGPAVALQFAIAPSATAAAGVALAAQPQLRVVDASGNTVTLAGGTLTTTVDAGASVIAGRTTTITAGVATVTLLRLGGAVGSYTLSFSDGTRVITSPFALTVGAASVVVADSGNSQSGAVSTVLGNEIVARVADAFGNPVSGRTVTWGIASGGGSTGAPSAVTDAAGRVRVSWTLGSAPGTNVVTATAAGVTTPASFSALASPAGSTRSWVGGTSASWTVAANWSPATVPVATDNVFVPSGTTFAPALSAAASVNDLVIMAAVPMALGAQLLTVNGNLDGGTAVTATTGGFVLAGAGKTFVGQNLPSLVIAANSSISARTTVVGSVTVTSGTLSLGSATLAVAGTFATSGTGTLTMVNAADSLIAGGSASFGGGGTSGQLTNGRLLVAGNFTQTGATSPASFAASASHVTEFFGVAVQTITFANAGTSRFNHAVFNGPGGAAFAAAAEIAGNDTVRALSGAITGAGVVVLDGDLVDASSHWAPTSTQFTKVNAALPASLTTNATFDASQTLSANLTVTGSVTVRTGTFTLNNRMLKVLGSPGSFATTGAGTLTMTAALDTLDVAGSALFSGGSEAGLLTDGGLTVRGSFTQGSATSPESFQESGTHRTWLAASAAGTVAFATPGASGSTSRFARLTFANSGAGLTVTTPVFATDSITLAAGARVLGGSASQLVTDGALSALASSQLGAAGASIRLLSYTTTLVALGTGSADTVAVAGAARVLSAPPAGLARHTLRIGTTSGINTFAGAVTITDTLIVDGGGAAVTPGTTSPLIVGGLQTRNGGRFNMIVPTDSVTVTGAVKYDGGISTLSAGSLVVMGDFTQLATATGLSFQAFGIHRVFLAGGAKRVSFATPGTGTIQSRFNRLYANGTAVDSMLTSVAVTDTLYMQGGSLSLHGLAGTPGTTLALATLHDTTTSGVIRSGATGTGFTVRILTKIDDGAGAHLPATYAVDTTVFNVSVGTLGAPQPLPKATLKHVMIEGFAKAPGAFTATITGDLIVRQGGRFTLDSALTLNVGGNFATADTARLVMTNAGGGAPTLNVAGNVTFGGGGTAGLLTAGTLGVTGNFAQSGAPDAFQASSGHVTTLAAGSRTVSFANPDSAVASPTGSRFGTLVVPSCGGTTTLLTNVAARDSLVAPPCSGGGIVSALKALTVHGVHAENLQFTTTNLVFNRVAGSAVTLGTVSFTGFYSTTNAFTVNNGTLGGGITWGAADLAFDTASLSTGAFVAASASGSAFTLTLTGVRPTGAIAGKFAVAGTASVTWP